MQGSRHKSAGFAVSRRPGASCVAMSDRDQRQFVTVKMATAMTGIPERTLRRWMSDGQLPAVAAKGGRLVAVDEVERLAGESRPSRGHGHDPPTMATAEDSATMAEQQVATLRDGLVAPLVALTEQLTTVVAKQAETIGKLGAERDVLERRVRELEAQSVSSPQPQPDASQTTAGAREKPRQRRWWLHLFGVDE